MACRGDSRFRQTLMRYLMVDHCSYAWDAADRTAEEPSIISLRIWRSGLGLGSGFCIAGALGSMDRYHFQFTNWITKDTQDSAFPHGNRVNPYTKRG
jgi:hypothetical protein